MTWLDPVETTLREWRVILAQAAVDSMQRDGENWQPVGWPYPPGAVETPCAVVVPGGDDGEYITLDTEERSFTSHLGTWKVWLLAGVPAEPAWDLLDVMVARIFGLPELVKADERATTKGARTRIRRISEPQKVDDFGGQALLGCYAAVTIGIGRPVDEQPIEIQE